MGRFRCIAGRDEAMYPGIRPQPGPPPGYGFGPGIQPMAAPPGAMAAPPGAMPGVMPPRPSYFGPPMPYSMHPRPAAPSHWHQAEVSRDPLLDGAQVADSQADSQADKDEEEGDHAHDLLLVKAIAAHPWSR